MKRIAILVMMSSVAVIFSFSVTSPDEAKMKLGFQTLQNSCATCHSMNGADDGIAGPTWAAIRKAYVKKGLSRTTFAKDLSKFMAQPNEQTSKMPDAVKRYGMMITMYMTDEQLDAIAEYVYHTELDKPGWYEAQFEKDKQKYTK